MTSTSETADLLTALPTHVATQITGERRRKLVDYLRRWNEYQAALALIDTWLVSTPHLATLRELRATMLLELGQARETLALLDEIDAERGASVSRRASRIRALAVLRRWPEAFVLADEMTDQVAAWRTRAELLQAQGLFAEAEQALVRAAEHMADGATPFRSMVELALAAGDAQRACALLHTRQTQHPDTPLATRELQLLHEATLAAGDHASAALFEQALAERRMEEAQTLRIELGLEREPAAEVSPGVELLGTHEDGVVDEHVLAALNKHFGFPSLRSGQATVIRRVLQGESVLGILPTGAGKSLTYQLPALLIEGATLVISPLIALMKDQIDNLPPALAEQATTINSALEGRAVAERLRGIAEGRYRLIFVAPERLRQQTFVQSLRRCGVARVVIDEAHCVSLWGMSFRPDYLFIRRALAELGQPPVLALTATATPETEIEIKTHLGELASVRTSIFRPNLRFEVAQVSNKADKLVAVVDLCKTTDGPIVVYVRSREGCEEVAHYLRQHRVAAEHYHAQIGDRASVQDRFMRGETRVLVATVAFGMGVDKADVRAIIHYNLPQSVEAYYQEAGRAGRDGLPARCVLLYAPTDKGQLTGWLREETLTKEYLREVYRGLRQQIGGTWGLVSFEELRRNLREVDDTKMRVAVGLLERVGLLRRHFDLPRNATIALRDAFSGDERLAAISAALELDPGIVCDVDLVALAKQLTIAPDELERWLIDLHTQGSLRYGGASRDALLELRPAGADIAAQLDALLAEYSARQNERVEAIAAYARSARCRHRTIAEHFGEHLAACETACDVCAPHAAGRPVALAPRPDPKARYSDAITRQAALEAVAELPNTLGEKELVCVLLGMPGYPTCAVFGRCAGADFAAIRSVVSGLIAAGQLANRRGALSIASIPVRGGSATQARDAVLRCLSQLPFAVGKSGLAKVLKGASGSPIGPDRCADYAALAHLTQSAIEAEIEQLISAGALQRSEGPRPLLSLATPIDF